MNRTRILLGTFGLATALAAWSSQPVAGPPASDLVARAAGQELSAENLAAMFAVATVPPTKANIATAAELWVGYQLLAYANVRGDELTADTKLVDDAMWAQILDVRGKKLYEMIRKRFPVADTANLEQRYLRGEWVAAQHILFIMPQGGAGLSQLKQDSIKSRAEDVLRRATPDNFSALALEYTQEAGGKASEGRLPVMAAGDLVPEFATAVQGLKPGQIAPHLVRTEFGYHIIRRMNLAEVRKEFIEKLGETIEPRARDAYLAKLRADGNVVFKPGAARMIRDLAANLTPGAAKADMTVLATSRVGDFTASHLAMWIEALHRSSPIPERLANSPDTTVLRLVGTFIEQDLINAEAIRLGVTLDTAEMHAIRSGFATMVNTASQGLRVDAKALDEYYRGAPADKQRFVASSMEVFLAQTLSTGGQNFVEIPAALGNALRAKYPSRVNYAAVDRVVERATAMRTALDSSHARKGQ